MSKNKFITSILISVIIIPQITFASWWNPFTWNVFSFFKKDKVTESQVESESSVTKEEIKNKTNLATSTQENNPIKLEKNKYTDSKWGFTLQFPDSWSSYTVKHEESNSDNSVFFSVKDQANIFAIVIFTKSQWDNYLKNDLKTFDYITENDSYVFASQSHQNGVERSVLVKDISSILSTFKLIDSNQDKTSDWNIYTSNKFDLSFNYLKEWEIKESNDKIIIEKSINGGGEILTMPIAGLRYVASLDDTGIIINGKPEKIDLNTFDRVFINSIVWYKGASDIGDGGSVRYITKISDKKYLYIDIAGGRFSEDVNKVISTLKFLNQK